MSGGDGIISHVTSAILAPDRPGLAAPGDTAFRAPKHQRWQRGRYRATRRADPRIAIAQSETAIPIRHAAAASYLPAPAHPRA